MERLSDNRNASKLSGVFYLATHSFLQNSSQNLESFVLLKLLGFVILLHYSITAYSCVRSVLSCHLQHQL